MRGADEVTVFNDESAWSQFQRAACVRAHVVEGANGFAAFEQDQCGRFSIDESLDAGRALG